MCYSLPGAKAVFSEHHGTWPGVEGYTPADLPPKLLKEPEACHVLPQGFRCYPSQGASDERCTAGPKRHPHLNSACDGCGFTSDPFQATRTWSRVDSPMFGNKCYTYDEAKAQLQANDGHWPGLDDYQAMVLGLTFAGDDLTCLQLPEGFPCYRNAGDAAPCSEAE
eukprot:3727356-Prymnesium_polylepis.1